MSMLKAQTYRSGFFNDFYVPRLLINNIPRLCVVSFNPKTEKNVQMK